ncbi:hypothetical protein KFK09_009642 [Dendrobium nobile]|uniref:Uncharacterized protein n=1 Tax=Dendrobium nobile TaxID=94219 RepID=A0A8T3BM04_DENNO|nr:hypothetical protein KFK09_009642 [Dendrobium nobile]
MFPYWDFSFLKKYICMHVERGGERERTEVLSASACNCPLFFFFDRTHGGAYALILIKTITKFLRETIRSLILKKATKQKKRKP